MTVTVNTSEYVSNHGKTPKGFGSWAFWMGADTSDIRRVHWFNSSYGEAKKKAIAMAKELGYTTITVGS